ncbi:putative immune-type receptor 13 isoform 1 precursor [Silurus asotus]|uniref:Immune-type receptor 13 isoform 1 n=1 Tax=Silurus asotus TaxID=30991 RepID=A0AAD5AXQ8_SILAS|nr:putative immune-type receptor 13 isoform 1 precursor [Silurus asotus]
MIMIALVWITSLFFNKIVCTYIKGVDQLNPFISAVVGDNVTLKCFRIGEVNTDSIVWYKQKVGQKPWVMVTVQHEPKYENDFNPPKFSIEQEKKEDKDGFHLKIANVEPSDEATYYCGHRDFLTRFGNGTFLSVAGHGDVKVSVLQSSMLNPVPAGASVTLQCSVLFESRTAELQVLWFKAALTQSHPQIIYTQYNSSLQCESESSKQTCVYNFSKKILSLNDTGTYYCAVTVCGKLVFGNGTRVHLVSQGSVTDETLSQDCVTAEVNYAALSFTERTGKRGRVKRRQPQDIIYSDVRRPFVT